MDVVEEPKLDAVEEFNSEEEVVPSFDDCVGGDASDSAVADVHDPMTLDSADIIPEAAMECGILPPTFADVTAADDDDGLEMSDEYHLEGPCSEYHLEEPCTLSADDDPMADRTAIVGSPALEPPASSATAESPSAVTPLSPTGLTGPTVGPPAELCAGCQKPITERYLLRALDRHWHEDCLRCSCCDCRLGEVGSTLFTRSNLLLCRRDYLRLFGVTGCCSACTKMIPAFEMIMRAKDNVYHLECFACHRCNQRFCIGDKFYLCNNRILCEFDYEEQQRLALFAAAVASSSTTTTTMTTPNPSAAALASTSCASSPPSSSSASPSLSLQQFQQVVASPASRLMAAAAVARNGGAPTPSGCASLAQLKRQQQLQLQQQAAAQAQAAQQQYNFHQQHHMQSVAALQDNCVKW